MKFINNLFHGRIGRLHWFIGWIITTIVIGLMSSVIFVSMKSGSTPFFFLFLLVPIIFLASVHAKRFHDINITGLAAALGFIPVVGFIVLLALLVIEGTKGPNKYGEQNTSKSILKSFYSYADKRSS